MLFLWRKRKRNYPLLPMIIIEDLNIFVSFKYGFSAIDDFEMPLKGYRNDVIVTCPDGNSYQLCFYDNIRLSQDIAEEKIIFERGLVVVQTVDMPTIKQSVIKLWKANFFNTLVPLK